jgi:hypothetical protein
VRAVAVAREQRARLLELRAVAFLTAHEEAAGAPRTEITALKELVDRFPADAGLADLRAARALLARS